MNFLRMNFLKMPRINRNLVKFLANNLCREIGFTVPIFFHVFLIIRLFGFPARFISSNRRQFKDAKIKILNRVLHHYLYESGCSNLQMPRWWDNSHRLHRHRFLEAIYNRGCFKPWTFKLLYSTELHGFSNSAFHQLCDRQGPTMTVMTLNGKIVVAFVEKSWDTQDDRKFEYQEDRSCKMFHVTSTGEIVKLRCKGLYNYRSSGPDFKFLHVNLDTKEASSSFPENNKYIFGDIYYSFGPVESVVVLKMSISFDRFPKSLLTQIARAAAPFLPIRYPPCFSSPSLSNWGKNIYKNTAVAKLFYKIILQ